LEAGRWRFGKERGVKREDVYNIARRFYGYPLYARI